MKIATATIYYPERGFRNKYSAFYSDSLPDDEIVNQWKRDLEEGAVLEKLEILAVYSTGETQL